MSYLFTFLLIEVSMNIDNFDEEEVVSNEFPKKKIINKYIVNIYPYLSTW